MFPTEGGGIRGSPKDQPRSSVPIPAGDSWPSWPSSSATCTRSSARSSPKASTVDTCTSSPRWRRTLSGGSTAVPGEWAPGLGPQPGPPPSDAVSCFPKVLPPQAPRSVICVPSHPRPLGVCCPGPSSRPSCASATRWNQAPRPWPCAPPSTSPAAATCPSLSLTSSPGSFRSGKAKAASPDSWVLREGEVGSLDSGSEGGAAGGLDPASEGGGAGSQFPGSWRRKGLESPVSKIFL